VKCFYECHTPLKNADEKARAALDLRVPPSFLFKKLYAKYGVPMEEQDFLEAPLSPLREKHPPSLPATQQGTVSERQLRDALELFYHEYGHPDDVEQVQRKIGLALQMPIPRAYCSQNCTRSTRFPRLSEGTSNVH
jgi:hypothetical protein